MVLEDSDKTLELFLRIGLDERTARNTIANNKVTANLTAVIHEVRFHILLFFYLDFFLYNITFSFQFIFFSLGCFD